MNTHRTDREALEMDNRNFVRLLTPKEKTQTECDACREPAAYEIHLVESTKVFWLCPKHRANLIQLCKEIRE